MSFKKPFRAVPLRSAPHVHAAQFGQGTAKLARSRPFPALTTLLCIIMFAAVWSLTARIEAQLIDQIAAEPAVAIHYAGCNAARAAGVAPLWKGQPGYRPEMDGDGDGIACEPHRR